MTKLENELRLSQVSKKRKLQLKLTKLILLSVGFCFIFISAFINLYFLTIVGTALIFWGLILFYVTTDKYVQSTFFEVAAGTSINNIERLLKEFNLTEKGIYLPPRNLAETESSLIFIPETAQTLLPSSQETSDKILSPKRNGIFLTPPGLAFSELLAKELGKSFVKINIADLPIILPRLLEDLQIAQNVSVYLKKNQITIKLSGSIFSNICRESKEQTRAHTQVGCLLTSSLACIIAKVTGKPTIILNEAQINSKPEEITIDYQISGE